MTKPSRKLPWMQAFQGVRKTTQELCRPLAVEDYVIQSVLDVSPPKWHLAHTTWFFETFVLLKYLPNYQTFDPQFHYLFNSYYHGVGEPFPRQQRGLLSRPTVDKVYEYRNYVDKHLLNLIDHSDENQLQELESLMMVGINHEQQHQELLLMDIKYNFSVHPGYPTIYQTNQANMSAASPLSPIKFYEMEGGLVEIGHSGPGFCFDNELPRHQKFLKPYQIANRLVTNQEYCEFIEAGGYKTPRWWLADGWDFVQSNQWQAPFYWIKRHDQWQIFTLSGLKQLNPAEPVSHVSYFEADAYARWRDMRLPTEEEWEHFVVHHNISPDAGNFMENRVFHPQAISQDTDAPMQFFGDLWEWTSSSYSPYQGFVPFVGALSEYNAKFMNNQRILRGGGCVTPQSHVRASYRNFFQPEKRWQFSGIRLAADV